MLLNNFKKCIEVTSQTFFPLRERNFIWISYIKLLFFKKVFGDTKIYSFLGWEIYTDSFENLRTILHEVFLSMDYYVSLNTDKPNIIDCGANVGITTLFFKYLYPKSKILAIEPSPSTFKFLEKNIRYNNISNVSLLNYAVSNSEGEVSFFNSSYKPGGSTMVEDVYRDKKSSGNVYFEEIKVKSIKLSDYIKEKVHLLKMDIEGAEGLVFADLDDNKIFDYIENIVFEYHYNKKNKNNTLSDIIEILERNGYDIYIYSSGFSVNLDKCGHYHFMIRASKH